MKKNQKPPTRSLRTSKLRRSDSANGDFVKSLRRGLAVIQAFGADRARLSLSDVARLTDMTRAAARRYLLSLRALGFVGSDGKLFWLEPRVLNLGYSYLSSVSWIDFAQPILREVADRLSESCSASVLDGTEVVYVARVQVSRIIGINLTVGTRLPAAVTSMGRVLLAALPPEELDRTLAAVELRRYTENTVTSIEELKKILQTVRVQRYAYVDQELENGLRSIAVPIIGSRGETIGAVNIGAHVIRVKKTDMVGPYLDALREAAAKISEQSRLRPL
jgi:IclR family pca regulon transcriptional regulator